MLNVEFWICLQPLIGKKLRGRVIAPMRINKEKLESHQTSTWEHMLPKMFYHFFQKSN